MRVKKKGVNRREMAISNADSSGTADRVVIGVDFSMTNFFTGVYGGA